MSYVWFGAFFAAAVILVFALRRIVRLTEERDGLDNRAAFVRHELLPFLDDILYREIKAWRKDYPKAGKFVIGQGMRENSDRIVRLFYWLGPTPEGKQKLEVLLGKLGGKFGLEISVEFPSRF